MKTKLQFFMVGLLVLVGVNRASAQQNINVTAPVVAGIAPNNTLVGFEAGFGLTVDPLQTDSAAANTFVGSQAGGSHIALTGTRNSFFGAFSGVSLRGWSSDNTFLGARSGEGITGGDGNTFIGSAAGQNAVGVENTFIGAGAGLGSHGDNNFFMGRSAGQRNRGSGNFYLGFGAGEGNALGVPDGHQNIFIGRQSGNHVLHGSFNAFIGFQSGFRIENGENNVFLGDSSGSFTINGYNNTYLGAFSGLRSTGFGNVFLGTSVGEWEMGDNQLMIDNSGTIVPLIRGDFAAENLTFNVDENAASSVIINSNGTHPAGTTGLSGLRFTNLRNDNLPTANPLGRVLSVSATGEVILVDDQQGPPPPPPGITNSCGELSYITKDDGAGNLLCSQIYDTGTSSASPTSCVYVGWKPNMQPAPNYTTSPSPYTLLSGLSLTRGYLRLQVKGNVKAAGVWITSDANYKTQIDTLDNPLQKVLALKGCHYEWDTAANPEMDFDEGIHTGFIAQEVETVLPHLVMEQEMLDQSGKEIKRKSVNYIELIPYLVESIKEQEKKIERLTDEVNCLLEKIDCGFEYENKQLLQFSNTKIISVSPNPSRDVISVSINVEKGIDNATLQVYDLTGKLLNSLNIKDRGNDISKTFQKDNFGTGVYIVSLMVNGKSIDSKKFIFE